MSAVLAVDFGQGVSDAWSNIANAIPKLVLAIVILVVAFVVAKALAKITNAVLERVGFDNAVERGGVKQALAKSKYDASDIVAKIVYYAVMLIGLSMAFGVFGPNPISDYLSAIVAYLPKLFVAILIVVIAAAIAKAVKDLVSNMLGGLSYGNAVATLASVIVLVIGVFAALDQLQIAQRIVGTTYTALLVMVVGVTIVGVGGGLVRPMQQRWERWLGRMEEEAPRAKEQAQQARQSSGQSSPYPSDSFGDQATTTRQSGSTVASGAGYADAPTEVYGEERTTPPRY